MRAGLALAVGGTGVLGVVSIDTGSTLATGVTVSTRFDLGDGFDLSATARHGAFHGFDLGNGHRRFAASGSVGAAGDGAADATGTGTTVR